MTLSNKKAIKVLDYKLCVGNVWNIWLEFHLSLRCLYFHVKIPHFSTIPAEVVCLWSPGFKIKLKNDGLQSSLFTFPFEPGMILLCGKVKNGYLCENATLKYWISVHHKNMDYILPWGVS